MNPPQAQRTCPDCGAAVPAGADHCWLCRWDFRAAPPAEVSVSAGREPELPPREMPVRGDVQPVPVFQFGLSAILILVTLASVFFSMLTFAPGLAIVLAIFVTPALLRTWRVSQRRRAKGTPMSPRDLLQAFGLALGVAIIIGVAAGVTFFATCFAGFFGGAAASHVVGATGEYVDIGWGLLTGIALGTVATAVVGYMLIRRVWLRTRPRD